MRHAVAVFLTLALAGNLAIAHKPPDEFERDDPGPCRSRKCYEPRVPPPATTPPPQRLHAVLAAHRARHLALLRAYRVAGVFPRAPGSGVARHPWRDPDGRLGVIAALLVADGQAALVRAIAHTHGDDVRLASVQTGRLRDWVLTSGFTSDELAQLELVLDPSAAKTLAEREAAMRATTEDSLATAVGALVQDPELAWLVLE